MEFLFCINCRGEDKFVELHYFKKLHYTIHLQRNKLRVHRPVIHIF